MSSNNFWLKLKRPFFVLAPMADVTDAAFRQIIAKYGKPDVFFTEFVSADGLMNPIGRERLKRELYFTSAETPIVAQLFSADPSKMAGAAKYAAEMGFSGIDINMGCPDKGIEKQGSGAALIKSPQKAKELIAAVRSGAPDLPVSVKTRIGYGKPQIVEWIGALLENDLDALTVHLRTRKEMSKVPAQWDRMTEIRELAQGSKTLILGNGDVVGIADAKEKAKNYAIDGVMLGRAIYGNPWLFSGRQPALREKINVMAEHAELYWELFGPTKMNKKLFGGHTKDFAIMKKHFKAYASGFPGAAELRAELMAAEDAVAIRRLINEHIKTIKDEIE